MDNNNSKTLGTKIWIGLRAVGQTRNIFRCLLTFPNGSKMQIWYLPPDNWQLKNIGNVNTNMNLPGFLQLDKRKKSYWLSQWFHDSLYPSKNRWDNQHKYESFRVVCPTARSQIHIFVTFPQFFNCQFLGDRHAICIVEPLGKSTNIWIFLSNCPTTRSQMDIFADATNVFQLPVQAY